MAPRLSVGNCELIDTRSFDKKQEVGDVRRSRTVSFAIKQDLLFPTLEELASWETTWYSKQEIEQFKKENSRSVQVMLSGKHRHLKDFCERGLENMTRAGSVQSKNRKKFSYKVVLDEQQKQRENGVFDFDAIAQAYEKAASRSRMSAVARGQSDASAVHC